MPFCLATTPPPFGTWDVPWILVRPRSTYPQTLRRLETYGQGAYSPGDVGDCGFSAYGWAHPLALETLSHRAGF